MAMFKEKGLTVQTKIFVRSSVRAKTVTSAAWRKYNFRLTFHQPRNGPTNLFETPPSGSTLFPGAVELVRACRKCGLKVAVASSADRFKLNAT